MHGGWQMYKFPKDFTEVTVEYDGYPQYKRRNDGKYVTKNGVPLDNRYIVPTILTCQKIQCTYQC